MKQFIILIFIIVLLSAAGIFFFLQDAESKREKALLRNKEAISATPLKDLILTVTYDNNPYNPKLETAWGFSCFIRGAEKNILFDTGGNGTMLLENMNKLGISPKEIELVVLSHIHGDHVGGLPALLEINPNITVYLPKSFPESLKDEVKNYGARVVEVKESLRICRDVYSTGEFGSWIKEQSLIIHTDRGLIIITGCAHPGIVETVRRSKSLIGDDVLFVMGGFHLGGKRKGAIKKIISQFRELEVHSVGPCHCTGDTARELFEQEYKKSFFLVGVGRVIMGKELQ